MDIQILINTMNNEEFSEFGNKNSNTTQCDCINNDDEKSLTFSENNKNIENNEITDINNNNTELATNNQTASNDCIQDNCSNHDNSSNHGDNTSYYIEEEYCCECEECICNKINEDNEDNEDTEDDEDDDSGKRTLIYYNENDDMYNEELNYNYHIRKHFGNWQYAKMIISHSYNNKQATEFFWDYLVSQFQENNDNFDNIKKVYYKNDLDIGIIYEFDNEIAKYLVDNIKIQSYKPKGYIFNGAENQNKWEFKIVVITSNGIYTANRYINENTVGFY